MAIIALIIGLILLVWSADRFVDGAASTAFHLGMPPLLIGMLVVGFGTSAPELLVSALAAVDGSPGMALGNAYGSNIANIALILGITALVSPIVVQSSVLRKELPIITIFSALTAYLIFDLELTRLDAGILLTVFTAFMGWTIYHGMKDKGDALGDEMEIEGEDEEKRMPLKRGIIWLLIGLTVLIASSRILVWGAVSIAEVLGISDMMIGLTIVAIGTSLPELASSVVAARKGEDDIALGNVLGSNIFNTLGVVGIAGMIQPFKIPGETLYRDMPVMGALTLALFLLCYSFRKGQLGRITRPEGVVLVLIYVAYTGWLIRDMLAAS